MRTGFKIAVAVGLASLVVAAVALAGGGGYRRGGGPGPGFGGGAPAGPQGQAPWMEQGAWGRGSGPQVAPGGPGWGARSQINNPPAPNGNYGFCPNCGAPCPCGGWAAPGAGFRYGPGEGREPRLGRGCGTGIGSQRGPWGLRGEGFGRRYMMRGPGPMNYGWGHGLPPGRGGEGFQPQVPAPWGRPDGREWRQPGSTGEPNAEVTPPQPPQRPDRGGFWGPPEGGAWRGRGGMGLRPWGGRDIEAPEGADRGGPGAAPTDKPPVAPEETEGAEQPKPQ